MDYEATLKERDVKIEELEGEIAQAVKTAESAEKLRAEMDELRRQGDGQRVGFELRLAGARNVKAARALLPDYDNDIEKLKVTEPWLFGAAPAAPQPKTGGTGGGRLRQGRETMANSIAYTKNYTAILDEVYKRAACSTCLNSPRRMARAGRNAKEIMAPKIEVSGLGDYTRNVGYKTGSITYEFETKTFNYDRGIRLLADVMDVEETDAKRCFFAVGQ